MFFLLCDEWFNPLWKNIFVSDGFYHGELYSYSSEMNVAVRVWLGDSHEYVGLLEWVRLELGLVLWNHFSWGRCCRLYSYENLLIHYCKISELLSNVSVCVCVSVVFRMQKRLDIVTVVVVWCVSLTSFHTLLRVVILITCSRHAQVVSWCYRCQLLKIAVRRSSSHAFLSSSFLS